jgi:biotin carboxyl carrier protein
MSSIPGLPFETRVSDPASDTFEVVPLGNGRYQVIQGATRRIAFAVTASEAWVFIDGRVYQVSEVGDRPPRKSRADDHDALTAPMPATVLAIHVATGQRVERNDVVMVLEAMKMELPIRSPRDGVVKAVGCRVGELVRPGTRLVELEETGSEPARIATSPVER